MKRNFLRLKRLREFLKNDDSDVFIVMLPITTALLLLHRKYIKAPIIVSERNDPSIRYNQSFLNRLVMKKVYPKANNFVFQTKDAQKFYKNKLHIDGKVIPNAINEEFLTTTFSGKRTKKL